MFIRTARLLLRPGFPEDAAALAKAIADEDTARRLANLPWPYTLAHAQDWLASTAEQRSGAEWLMVLRRDDGPAQLVGGIGLRAGGALQELGYWVAPAYRGRGLATEAGRAVLATAQGSLRLPGLVAGHFIDNPQSGRVLEKLGFSPTGQVAERLSLARQATVPMRLFRIDFSPPLAKAA